MQSSEDKKQLKKQLAENETESDLTNNTQTKINIRKVPTTINKPKFVSKTGWINSFYFSYCFF